MSTSDSPPEVGQAFAEMQVTVMPPHGERTPARVLDIGFRSISLSVSNWTPFEGNRGLVQARLCSPHLTLPIEALCRVAGVACGESETMVTLDVMDWIGLREQLPAGMRQFLSLRSSERLVPGVEQRPDVEFACAQSSLYDTVKLYDLSIGGVSVLIPRDWAERLDRGDRVDLKFALPGETEAMQFIGFVRHVSFEHENLHCGILFDVNLTTDFMVKQVRLMRHLDRHLRRG